LQTLGFSAARVFGLVLAETVLLSLLGGAVGVGAATLALTAGGLSVGAEGVAIAVRPSAALALTGLAVALLVGVLAGLAPAWRAARADIVAARRAGGGRAPRGGELPPELLVSGGGEQPAGGTAPVPDRLLRPARDLSLP